MRWLSSASTGLAACLAATYTRVPPASAADGGGTAFLILPATAAAGAGCCRAGLQQPSAPLAQPLWQCEWPSAAVPCVCGGCAAPLLPPSAAAAAAEQVWGSGVAAAVAHSFGRKDMGAFGRDCWRLSPSAVIARHLIAGNSSSPELHHVTICEQGNDSTADKPSRCLLVRSMTVIRYDKADVGV